MTSALDDTWTECFESYKAEVKKLMLWDSVVKIGVDPERILSSPEIMDPKTDTSCNWKLDGTPNRFFGKGLVTDVAKLSEEEVLEIIDTLLARESAYLLGRNIFQSVFTFVYFLRMDELKEKNPVLYAYARGILRTLDFVNSAITMTTIRDEEEFTNIPPEIDLHASVPLRELQSDLDAAIASVTSEELKSRLQFRKSILNVFGAVFGNGQIVAETITEVVAACNAAVAAGKAITRTTAPKEDTCLFRQEMSVWLQTMVPTPARPAGPVNEAVQVLSTMFTQLATIQDVLAIKSLYSVTDFVETFALKRPILPTRAFMAILLFAENPSVSFLYGAALPQRIVDTLTTQHGAPIYGRVIDGHEPTIREITAFRSTAIPRVNANAFCRQLTESTRQWVLDVARWLLQFWEALLCNRGRCHRRLVNFLESLGFLHNLSLEIDMNTYLASVPIHNSNLPKEAAREMVVRSTVLTAFTADIVFQVMCQIVQLNVELDLFTKAELPAALFYLNFLNGSRLDNFTALYIGSAQYLPDRTTHKKTGAPLSNPVLTTRVLTVAPASVATRVDASRLLAELTYRTLAVCSAKQLVDLSSPPTALVSVARIFNNRIKAFARMPRSGYVPYEQCMMQFNEFAKSDKFPEIINGVIVLAKQISDRCKLFANDKNEAAHQLFAGIEKTARSTFVSLNLLTTLDSAALENFDFQMEFSGHPALLAFALKRKVKA